jgi:hypothetical protein
LAISSAGRPVGWLKPSAENWYQAGLASRIQPAGSCADSAPVGERVELGGPEALGIDAWAWRLFAATGDNRAVIADPHARYYGTELRGGELTPGAGARIGKVEFDTWFAANQQEAR